MTKATCCWCGATARAATSADHAICDRCWNSGADGYQPDCGPAA